jgi:hypothetical protein
MLLTGWLAFLNGGFFEEIIWLANPLYFLAFIAFFNGNNSSRSISYSLIATILALSFTTWNKVLENSLHEKTIEILNSGYWLWLSSI